jgi:hypothetical protein
MIAADISFPQMLERLHAFLQPLYLAILSENEWQKRWNRVNAQWE